MKNSEWPMNNDKREVVPVRAACNCAITP